MLLSIHNILMARDLNLNIGPVMNVVILIHHLDVTTSVKVLSSLIHILVSSRVCALQLHVLGRASASGTSSPLSCAITISFDTFNELSGLWIDFAEWVNRVRCCPLRSHLVSKLTALITIANKYVLLTIFGGVWILEASLTIVNILWSHVSRRGQHGLFESSIHS